MNTDIRTSDAAISFRIPVGSEVIFGDLRLPDAAAGVVVFSHGSGSSRFSPRNQFVAKSLHEAGLGTLLLDLLTEEEEFIDQQTRTLRFDLHLLAGRLRTATEWLAERPQTAGLPIGYFGASTGAAAGLIAAAALKDQIKAVVSRGGRPDLAGPALREVQSPTLLIVGGNDDLVIGLNQQALRDLQSPTKKLVVVPAASHLFEEPGTLEQVAQLASEWFGKYVSTPAVMI